ncbi:EAL domain-containing protein (plasmid) [Enterobacteriaceae bacterium Kacie_13]|nr:EAL domain-containing protein [Enterobacteriaceae bacterium Kacie_13]
MLLTLVYRSHVSEHVQSASLEELVAQASIKNETSGITGILLFDGTHFFQLLEGPEEAVDSLYSAICRDRRHHNVVELMRDYAPSRRFGNVGMELFDLRKHHEDVVLQAVLDKGTSKYRLTYDDRALQFLCTFVQAREKENYLEILPTGSWSFITDETLKPEVEFIFPEMQDYSFAFQPIVDPLSKEIVSYEATLRGPDGGSPMGYFSQLSRTTIYEADLKSKKLAFALASKMGISNKTLCIKLLPMTLVMVPDAVEFLVQEITANGLVPEQIVVAITENGVITREDKFTAAMKQLKASGMRLAIDDFGAGSAGLLLLTQCQPDKIMIDRNIICDVHTSGPKQAVVQAIIRFCSSLEVSVIATGVEKPEEWMWLDAAGICNFQGDLFAMPRLNGAPVVAWPEVKQEYKLRDHTL